MTLTALTFTLALVAQTPPPPPPPATAPVRPAPPATVALPSPGQVPMIAPMPAMPPLELDRALLEMNRALEAMPAMESIQGKLLEAELALSKLDRMDLSHVDFAHAELFEAGFQSSDAIRDRENSYYETGRGALDRRNWTDAINRFEQVIQLKGSRADAAMYWKAYAQSKNGQRAEALATVRQLQQSHPQSRYLNDAKALEIELNRGNVSPESQQDEDLKLLAIQGLQHSDPEQAVPLLEKILTSANGPRVKERALYVLALTNSTRARDILLNIAKGAGNPDLQRKAIDYLANHSQREGRSMLEEVYKSNNDRDVRMRVLRAYANAGDRARLVTAAQSEQDEELRMYAIRSLGNTGAITELSSLYDRETTKPIRMQIVRSLANAGAIERLQQIARNEKDPEIRLLAIRSFANAGRERTGTVLQDMYASETTTEGKTAIINALHSQNNAEGLVAVARREKDPKMQEAIVRRLSTMTKSKVALDYLMEILNK